MLVKPWRKSPMKYLNYILLTLVGLLFFSEIVFAAPGGDLNLYNRASLTSRSGYRLTLGNQGASDSIEFVVNGVQKGYVNSSGLNGFTIVSPTLSSPTISGNLTFSSAAAKIIPGATSLTFRNNADTADNISIANAGTVTFGQGDLSLTAGNINFNGASKGVTFNTTGAFIGSSGANAWQLKYNNNNVWAIDSNITQNATNGGNIVLTKVGTAVLQPYTVGLTATGTTISDAFALTNTINGFATTASGTGAKLPDLNTGTTVIVTNGGANALLLYPINASGTINGGAGGAAISVAAGGLAICTRTGTNPWYCGKS